MKAAADLIKTHNPSAEVHRASCLRENLTSSSYGEGLETGRVLTQAPRQSLTRQLFFRWIKQNLRIKSFYGTSENAVRTQIWVAITVYALVAIIKKRLPLELPLYTFLQILSVTAFEKVPLNQLLTEKGDHESTPDDCNQLLLFNL